MAVKKITKVIEVIVCDVCERRVRGKGYKGKDGSVYDTMVCKMYDEMPTKEEYIKFRKSQLRRVAKNA